MEKIPVARIVEALEHPGAEYQHNGMARRFPDIRFIWWAGGANFTHHQDTNRLIQAWQKPELIVIHRMLLDRRRASCRYRSAGDHLV